MKARILSAGIVLSFLLAFFASAISAQNITATLTGTVTDTTGAVVPNATVTVHNNDTNTDVRTVTTDQTGAYTIPDLPVGTYTVTIKASSFKAFVANEVVLHVGDHRTLDVSLAVGQVSETVTVTSTEAPVETSSAAQSTTVIGTQVRELQLNNRNFIQLVALQPGVSSTEPDQVGFGGISSTLAVSVNGNRTSANNWTVDGADINDSGSNLTIVNVPSVDSLAEFKLERSTYDAQYGRSAGGQVNVVTKSGTSEFHGDAYEFVRNDLFNANTFLLDKAGIKKPPFRYNNFGYTIGGPVFIPGHYNTDKSKTFFFFSEEFRRTKTPSAVIATIPNPQELTGNFQGIATLNAASAPTGCITGNQISASCFSSNAKAFIANVYSKFTPDAGCAATALGCAATSAISPINNTRQEIVRLDQKITNKIQVFGRYMQDKIPTTEPGGLFAGSPLAGISSTATNAPGRNVVAHVTAQLTPTIINETAYNYSWGAINSNLTGVINSPAFVGALANNLPFTDPYKRVSGVTFPTGNISGVAIPSAPYFERNIDKNLYDDISWVKGVHTFRFGFAAQWMRKSENAVNPTNGTFNFRNIGGNPAIANFLLGEAQSFSQSARDIIPNLHFLNFEWYAQDDWKLRPNFTLNLGMRYSFFQNPHDDNPILDNFDPTVFNRAAAALINPATGNFATGQAATPANYANGIIVASNGCAAAQALVPGSPAPPTCSPFGGQVNPNYKKNVAPRIGFAWDPFKTGKTSVRGGYGIYFDRTLNGIWEQNSFVIPPIVQSVSIVNTANTTSPNTNLFDNPGAGTTAARVGPLSLHATGLPAFQVPYSQNWNLSVQREVVSNTLLEVAYVGSKGTHLLGEEDFNQVPLTTRFLAANAATWANALRPYPGYGPITDIVNIFDSNYNSLQVSATRRMNRGLTLGISYTLSRTLTDSPTDRSTAPYDTYNRGLDYGPANFSRNNIFVADYVYDLPFYREQQGVVGHVLGGWELSGITVFESGVPLTITQNNDPFNSNDFGAGPGLFPDGIGIDPSVVSPRPDLVLGQTMAGPKTANEWFNVKGWTDAIGHFGNSGRGVIAGPGFNNWDIAAIKNIRITERVNTQFRAEFFNAFNHPSFLGVSTNVDSSLFGQVTSTHDPRLIQFGLKLNF
ncbi:MAG TPA: carboxypeptidase regulatory-like domain-containing protein [Candidatus Methylomirabilis sp.]|nr:carboxypeptidase regulatory-like domain-containing protein [Candidatus Methylomirabilis sp.]